MLSDANNSIRFAADEASRRREALRSRRRPIQLLDYWLGEVEMLVAHDDQVVPEPMIDEIVGFIGALSPRLNRRLRRHGRSASNVLDILFDAEEQLLPKSPPDAA